MKISIMLQNRIWKIRDLNLLMNWMKNKNYINDKKSKVLVKTVCKFKIQEISNYLNGNSSKIKYKIIKISVV